MEVLLCKSHESGFIHCVCGVKVPLKKYDVQELGESLIVACSDG